MNRLPDMMVLDFCEYLNGKSRNGVTVLDLLSDESNHRKLHQYAKEYLNGRSYSFKGIIHKFIDSEYFDDSLHRFPPKYQRNLSLNLNDLRDLREMVKACHCYICCEPHFLDFLYSLGNNTDFPQWDVDEWSLINNVQHMLKEESAELMLKCMTSLGIDISTEIDFLVWILSSQTDPINIHEMPVIVFELFVDEYLSLCGKEKKVKKQLVKSFKQTDSYFFASLLERLLPNTNGKKIQNLRYVLNRYCNEEIPFKCLFLPLAAETKKYKKLIRDYWRDLHEISANHLDIYYSETDYGKSGAEIQSSISSLPQKLLTTFPCIVIWSENISKAKSIVIGGLSNKEIFYVVNAIVNAIKQDKSFDVIIKEVNKVAQDIRDKHRPTNNNTVNIQGDNLGIAIAKNTGSISNTSNINCTPSEFSKEVDEAFRRIREIEELTAQQQTLLTDILSEAKRAFDTSSEIDMEKSKSRFKDAMCFLGNVSVKVLSALSSLINLSKFLGIPK